MHTIPKSQNFLSKKYGLVLHLCLNNSDTDTSKLFHLQALVLVIAYLTPF